MPVVVHIVDRFCFVSELLRQGTNRLAHTYSLKVLGEELISTMAGPNRAPNYFCSHNDRWNLLREFTLSDIPELARILSVSISFLSRHDGLSHQLFKR